MNDETKLERIRSLFNRSGVALTLADPLAPDCPLVLSNPKFEELTGYAQREIEGQNCRFLQGTDRQRNEVARAEIREAIENRRECQVILKNRRKDGIEFDNLLFLHAIGKDGRYILGSQFELSDPGRAAVGARTHADKLMADLEEIGEVSAKLRMQGRRYLADAAAAMVTAWTRTL